MTNEEKHEYLGFDRFLQVVNTKYESELLELEKKYYSKEIDDKKFEELWSQLVKKIVDDKKI